MGKESIKLGRIPVLVVSASPRILEEMEFRGQSRGIESRMIDDEINKLHRC
jgi:hypothetical protein